MKNSILLILLFAGLPSFIKAQSPGELLEQWSARSPIEKTYLQTDREFYLAGETAWFKAYLYADFYPDTISTNLYVELLNAKAEVLAKKVWPVIYGCSKGQFDLPDTLSSGHYYLRAYSGTTLNQGEDFLFQKNFYVRGKKPGTASAPQPAVRVEFFPESGNFVAGLPNSVAVKITDGAGMPLNRTGIVKDDQGNKVAELISYHDGMGMFDILPATGRKYSLELDEDAMHTQYALPVAAASGLVLRLSPGNNGTYFEIYQQPANPSLQAAYMIGQMQHHPAFRMEIDKRKNDINGFIATQKLKSGIMQVTVFSANDLPLAERLLFIDNGEYRLNGDIETDTVQFDAKKKNRFSISFPDTVGGNFSVSVTDADYAFSDIRRENIFSSLLLTSDLKGYIHNPAWYFSGNDSAHQAADLLMMTNGWRRFAWKELPALVQAPLKFQDPHFISITGKVNIRETKKPLAGKQLFVLINSKDDSLSSSIRFMETDAQGRFRMDSLVFYGQSRVYVSDMNGRKNKWLDIYPDGDSMQLLPPIGMAHLSNLPTPETDDEGNMLVKLGIDYDAFEKANGILLKGITVSARKKTPVQELEDRYVSGLFSGLTSETIDLVNSREKIYQINIFDYIQGRIPGIKVQRKGPDYVLYYRQRFSLFGDPIPMTLYLNEMQTDSKFISIIPANQIALIKVYSSFVGAEGNGAGGVLAIYTKQNADLISGVDGAGDMFPYKGYAVVRQFYSPDYSVPPPPNAPADHRITLQWLPEVVVDGVNVKYPLTFYNNDRTQNFRIVVEGMTADGRMMSLEKVVHAATTK